MKSTSLPLFSPKSVFWRVNREVAVGLAAPRAVLLQIAHPLVAAGVAEHSEFRTHRFARLYRTALAATAITFCGRGYAFEALRTINRKHSKVHGVLKEEVGQFPAGTPYDANDAQLKLWVLSTITDSALLAYEHFVAPLSLEDRRSYYDDSLLAAELFGIPCDVVPKTYESFMTYMDGMLNNGSIQVGSQALEISRSLFSRTPSGLLLLGGSSMGICLLPERIRQEFQLDWRIRKRLHAVPGLCRAARRVLPAVLCASPAATLSEQLTRWRQFRHPEAAVEYHERP